MEDGRMGMIDRQQWTLNLIAFVGGNRCHIAFGFPF